MRQATLLLLVICLTTISNGQQVYKLFNAKLKSSDINGTNNFFVKNLPLTSRLAYDAMLSKTPTYWVGKVWVGNLRQPRNFLDLSNELAYHPLLDSIDMDFYATTAMKITDTLYANDSAYLKFADEFSALPNNQQKKNFLIKRANRKYFDTWNNLKIIVDESPITNTTNFEREIKLGIKLNIDTILLSKNLQGNAGLKAALYNMIDQDVEITGAYYDVRYSTEYISKIVYYMIDDYNKNIQAIKSNATKQRDQFTNALINFWDSDYNETAVIAGSTLLQLTTKYNVSRINKPNIGATIAANAQLPKLELAKLSGDLTAAFAIDKKFTGSAATTNYYCLTYAYDNQIESFGNQ